MEKSMPSNQMGAIETRRKRNQKKQKTNPTYTRAIKRSPNKIYRMEGGVFE